MFEVAINSVPLKLMSLGFLKKTPTKLVGVMDSSRINFPVSGSEAEGCLH